MRGAMSLSSNLYYDVRGFPFTPPCCTPLTATTNALFVLDETPTLLATSLAVTTAPDTPSSDGRMVSHHSVGRNRLA